jgi:SAM-dependent methyltransferase
MIIKKAIRKCPICDWDDAYFLHEQKFVLPEDHPLPDQYDVVRCIRCGFIYADTPASQEIYDDYYAEFSKYTDSQTSIGSGKTEWDAKRLKYTVDQLAPYLPHPKTRVLDIGCAQGGLLYVLKKMGFNNLVGVDPSLGCVLEVQQRDIEAYQGTLLHLPGEIVEFDMVILSHILEHIRDIRSAMKAVWTITKSNGVVYIEVPDALRYLEQSTSPFQDFNVEHINHFSLGSLTNLMQSFGFTLAETGQKVIELGPGTTSLVFYTFWRKTSEIIVNYLYHQDMQLNDRILEYIDQSSAILRNMNAKIQSALDKSPQIIVWGTGQLAYKLLAETCLGQAEIVAFVDGNPINHNHKIQNVLVLAPDQIKDKPYPILITSILHQKEIVNKVLELGLSNDIILLGD